MDLPPLSALRAFEAAARHQSFSAAGDELFVTHTAISHQMRKLEDWLGVALFTRHGRGVRLTTAGELLFHRTGAALREMADACARVKALGGRETLTIGSIPSIASRWLVPNLHDFTSAHPGLDVRLVYAHANQHLANGDLDALISVVPETGAGMVSTPLLSRITRPVASPGFIAQHGALDTAAQIARVPRIHDETRAGWREWLKRAGITAGLDDTWPVYQDFNLLVNAAIAGHGLALCPVEAYALEITRGDLVVVSDIAVNEGAAYYISHRDGAPPAVNDFVEWVLRLFKPA